jgi:hypothetical protein
VATLADKFKARLENIAEAPIPKFFANPRRSINTILVRDVVF